MAKDNWEKAKRIFAEALKLDPAARRPFLDDSCGDDLETRREVESLLNSFDDAGTFLEKPAAHDIADLIADSAALEAGKRFGHYEIVRQIGAGGMGVVYLAKDTKLERPVALKILNERFGGKESNLERFVKEAKAASSLNHPNILVIHEIGSSDDGNYIVSEFIDGQTLREVITRTNLTLPAILDIAIQIANAVAAAHSANIVHRDIKPENVIVRPDGVVKILDFGLAKLIEQKPASGDAPTVRQNETAKGLILGTVNYMSPEQAKAGRVDGRTDIFSFGVLLYEMVAGRVPFAGDSMSETLANLISAEPLPLSRFAASVPEELERIVSKTLRKDPDERFQTMKDLLTDLKALRENLVFGERLERLTPGTDNAANGSQFPTGVNNVTAGAISRSLTGHVRSNRPLLALVAALLVAFAALGYYWWSSQTAVSSTAPKRSLAVLPFINATQDPNAEYLSDGVTESIINNLSQLSTLRVMSRSSAFRFKNNQSDTRAIASQLGVETLVTGDINQLGDKLIINVRLIDPSDDSQIWGSQYVKNSADVIAVQNEIAQAVAQNLRLKLSPAEQQQITKRPTENPEAYQLYLRGRFHIFKLTPPEVNKGISYFQQAIEIDPQYALAYTGLSDAFRSLTLGSEMPPMEFLPKSKAAATKAIEIDATLTEAYTSLGSTAFWQWEWSNAEAHYKRALELNPQNADAHMLYAHLLSNTGRHGEALAEIKRGRELDPLFPFGGALEGQFLLHAGRPEEALDRLRKTFDLAPTFWLAHLFAASAHTQMGQLEEAVSEARKARELSPAQTISVAYESYALAKLGRENEARALLEELLKLSETKFVPPAHVAMIYNGLGESEKTFEWLEKGFDQRDPKMAFLKVEPKWANLRSDPRFLEMLARIRLN